MGFGDSSDGYVTWEAGLSALLRKEIPDLRLKNDTLGGLGQFFHGMTLMDGNFQPLSASHLEQERTVFISLAQQERCFLFVKRQINTNTLYSLFDVSRALPSLRKLVWCHEHDRLTQVYNKETFLVRAKELLSRNEHALMVFVDMDDLKQVNDNWGHSVGDDYIVALSRHMEQFFSACPENVIGRLAGDEFAVCVGSKSKEERDAALTGFEETAFFFLPSGEQRALRFTTGAAKYPEDASSIEELLAFSDFAMVSMKKMDKGGIHFFRKEEHEAFLALPTCQEDLRKIIDNNLISFTFTPYIEALSRQVVIFEMFPTCRLQGYEDIELVSIIAKRCGKMLELDRLVLKNLQDEFKKLGKIVFSQTVTFGHMPQSLFHHGELEKLATESGFPYAQMCLCFSAEMRDSYVRMRAIDTAQNLGLKFGFKKFSQSVLSATLVDFKPNTVKISKELSVGIARQEDKQEIVHSVVELCRNFEVAVASGDAHCQEDLDCLINLGINFLGGQAVHPELTAEEIPRFLSRNG